MANPLAQFITDGRNVLNSPAYERAKAAGYTDEQIKTIASQNGMRFEGYVTKKLNGLNANNPLAKYISGSDNILNSPAYEKARADGLTDDQIKAYAQQYGTGFQGWAAKKFVDPNTTPSPQASAQPSPQQSPSPGAKASLPPKPQSNPLAQFLDPASPNRIGLAALERARAAGYTDQQIQDLAAKNGLTFWGAAQQAINAKQRGGPGAVANVQPGPSPVPDAQKSYEAAIRNKAQTSGPSAADLYQSSFQNSLNNYSGGGNAQQNYESAVRNLSAGGGADQTAQYQSNYEKAISNSSPSDNQQANSNYQSAYSEAIKNLSTNAASSGSGYDNYAKEYQAATGNFDYGTSQPSSGGEYQKAYEAAIKNYSVDAGQSAASGYQAAYEKAAKQPTGNASGTDYQGIYNDLLKRTSENYDKEIGRYQKDLTDSQSKLNQAISDRDAAVERAKAWETRFNDETNYAANEQLRGVRTGGSRNSGPSSEGADLASGRAAYSDSSAETRQGARGRGRFSIAPAPSVMAPKSAYR